MGMSLFAERRSATDMQVMTHDVLRGKDAGLPVDAVRCRGGWGAGDWTAEYAPCDTIQPATLHIVTEALIGDALRNQPGGIDQIPGGHGIEQFLQIL
jgi:hypothetical protein